MNPPCRMHRDCAQSAPPNLTKSAPPFTLLWELSMHMREELQQLILIARDALKEEDRRILSGIAANPTAYPGGNGGILRFNNERYYQFIVARALITSSFPLAVTVETDYHDLVLYDPKSAANGFAAIEMKRWMSENGKKEILNIKTDLDKLRRCKKEHALMLIFSAQPKTVAPSKDDNLKWLSEQLGVSDAAGCSAWKTYSFTTKNEQGGEFEFWVAGLEVDCSRSTSA